MSDQNKSAMYGLSDVGCYFYSHRGKYLLDAVIEFGLDEGYAPEGVMVPIKSQTELYLCGTPSMPADAGSRWGYRPMTCEDEGAPEVVDDIIDWLNLHRCEHGVYFLFQDGDFVLCSTEEDGEEWTDEDEGAPAP